MNKISLALTVLFTLAMIVIIAPNIFALNQGKILRNIAIWLAVLVGLGLFYQNFGPGSAHPLFALPEAMTGPATSVKIHAPVYKFSPLGRTPEKTEDDKPNDDNDGVQGFTPPKE